MLTRRVVTILTVAVVVAVTTGAVTAMPVAPESATAVASSDGLAQTVQSNNTTMWTGSTTVSDSFDGDERLAMSDADADGTLHVAYTQDGTIRYAEVTTRGQILADTELVTPRSGVGEITIAATPDGRAHVVFETGVENDEIRRIAIHENGTTDFEQTFVDGTDVTLQKTLETGPRGRVYTLVRNEFTTPQSGTERRAELWVLNGRDRTTVTREFGTDWIYSGGLGIQDGQLYAAYVTQVGEYPNRHPAARLRTWDVSGSDIEREDDQAMNNRVFNAQGATVEVTESGYAFFTYSGDEAMRMDVIEIDSGEEIGTSLNEERLTYSYSVVIDRNDMPYVFDPSGYRRYDPGTLEQDVSGAAPGAALATLNRDGYPSILRRTESDELVYQSMVVRGLENYTNLYQRFETVNEALVDRSRDIRINVTVAPADGAAFVAGSEAEVTVQSSRVDPTAVSLQYQGESYAPGEDGRASIPLESSGTHDLVVEYRGVSETMSIQVDGASEKGGTEKTTASGPGFGVVVAVLAVLSVGLLARVRQRQG